MVEREILMMTSNTAFLTERLRVRDWHEAEQAGVIDDLPAVVASMLTEPVTRWLPPDWQGPYSPERAASWIADRDREGPVLLVEDREHGQALGLVLLFEEATGEEDGVDVRLGYLLAEGAWGRGLGSELLHGFVAWCRARGNIRSVIGGVALENGASIRLLEREASFRYRPPRTGASSPTDSISRAERARTYGVGESEVARPARLELTTFWSATRCSIH